MMSVRKVELPFRIAVVGGAQASKVECELALELGRQLAGLGALVVCGGRGGVMKAVAQGAEAVVSVGGEWGTLSEIAIASRIGLSVGTLGTPPAEGLDLPVLENPVEAARWALERAQAFRGS